MRGIEDQEAERPCEGASNAEEMGGGRASGSETAERMSPGEGVSS